MCRLQRCGWTLTITALIERDKRIIVAEELRKRVQGKEQME